MSSKKALVYGGKGGLGTVLVSHFRSRGWWVCSVDIRANEEADENVLVDLKDDWFEQTNLRGESKCRWIFLNF